jgi:hypothetical protein
MHEMETIQEAHLVALQVPDHVPTGLDRRTCDAAPFVERFLHLVLPNVMNARLVRSVDRVGAVRLRDRDQTHRLAVSTTGNRSGDTTPNIRQPVCKSWEWHNRVI